MRGEKRQGSGQQGAMSGKGVGSEGQEAAGEWAARGKERLGSTPTSGVIKASAALY